MYSREDQSSAPIRSRVASPPSHRNLPSAPGSARASRRPSRPSKEVSKLPSTGISKQTRSQSR
eukprot:2590809-Pyramimonas_sp.AAC.1